MNELPSAAEAVLQRAREQHDPSQADAERSLARLHASLVFAPEALSAGEALQHVEQGGAASGGGTLLGAAKGLKLALLSVAVGGALGGVGYWQLQREPVASSASRPAIVAPAVSPAEPAPEAESADREQALPARRAPEVAPAAVPAQVEPARVASPVRQTERRLRARDGSAARTAATRLEARAPSPAPTSEAVPAQATEEREQPAVAVVAPVRTASELQLIDRAATSLRDGDATAALRVLDEHLALYPGGVLATERKGLRVLALCAAGRREQAQREAASFLAHAARSPLAARVQKACAEASTP